MIFFFLSFCIYYQGVYCCTNRFLKICFFLGLKLLIFDINLYSTVYKLTHRTRPIDLIIEIVVLFQYIFTFLFSFSFEVISQNNDDIMFVFCFCFKVAD